MQWTVAVSSNIGLIMMNWKIQLLPGWIHSKAYRRLDWIIFFVTRRSLIVKHISRKLPTQKINVQIFKCSLGDSSETLDFNVLHSILNSECFGKRIKITGPTLMITDSMEWEHRTNLLQICVQAFWCWNSRKRFFPRSSSQWPWLPPANEVWGKVIFSPACVILFMGEGGLHLGGRTPPNRLLRGYDQQAGGVRHTGMNSCLFCLYIMCWSSLR